MPEIICPHCDQPIYDEEALSCLFCGESLNRPIGVFGKLRFGASGMVCIFVLILVIFSFVLLITY